MPSWSPSNTPEDAAVTSPETDAATTAIERARRLLVQLLMGRPFGDRSQRPDK